MALQENKHLKKDIAVGALWVSFLRLSYRLIGLISTVILARLLAPEDFGVAAIAMSIFFLINTFSKFGFETVIVQHKNPLPSHYSTAWTFNLTFGLIAALIMASLSGYVGRFYENPDLIYITLVISLLFLLNGIKNTGVVDFQKNMTFDKEFKLHIIPKFISFFITIGLAVYFRNFWALVIGNVVLKLLEVINSFLMHPFRPSFTFKNGKELFGFSKWLMINNLLTFFNTKSPELILGKIISPHAAAIFNLSAEIGKMATSEIIANLNRAIYPGYAKVSSDLLSLQEVYKDSIRAIALIALPLGTGVALTSSFIIPIMLGDQWLEAIDPLICLSLGGAINALKSNSNYIYFSLGKPKISTFELVIRAIFFISSFYYLVNLYGVKGAAYSFLLTAILMFFLSNIILKFVLKLSVIEQIGLYVKPIISTIVMALSVVIGLEIISSGNNILNLVMATVIGGFSYMMAIVFIWFITGKREGPDNDLIQLLKLKLKKD